MTEEPYRWLEAISNRREYIREQLKGGTPVFAVSRPEGILLFGIGQGSSKVFEIYDRHAFAALGHPVDIEKVRQSAIEAAHLEGFNRSSQDVTLRRLIGFALSPSLKNSFEQIFSPPIMVEAIFAELGETPETDILVRVHFDGHHHYESSGVLVAYTDPKREKEAQDWLQQNLPKPAPNSKPQTPNLGEVANICMAAWRAIVDEKPFSEIKVSSSDLPSQLNGKVVEAALLDRKATSHVHYRSLSLAQLQT